MKQVRIDRSTHYNIRATFQKNYLSKTATGLQIIMGQS